MRAMKAYVLHGIGDLRLEDVERPVPGRNEALIAVKAAGICGSDIPRIYRTGAHRHPLVPGHEFSGVVVETGREGHAWLGKRVGVFPLLPCRACPPCRSGTYEMCRSYGYLGSRQDGGFAEYVTAPVKNLIELPESVSFEEAAMLEPMAVAVHAMRRASASPEDVAAVCGLGTIGLLLGMFLKEVGISRLLLIGNKALQRRLALSLGIPEEDFCDIRTEDAASWCMERTGGRGVDCFFECVGRDEAVALGMKVAAPSGRVMLVGNPYSDMQIPKPDYWNILRNQLTVLGTWNSSFLGAPGDDWHYALDRLARGRIAPGQMISHRLSFEDLEHGLGVMRDKTEEYCKVMMVTE